MLDENRVYTIAGIHPLDGVFDIDNTTLYTRLQAMDISSDLSSKFSYQFIAYNTQAATLEAPYHIDLDTIGVLQ